MLFCVVSLLIHLGAGYTSRSFNFDLPKNLADASTPTEVEITPSPLAAAGSPLHRRRIHPFSTAQAAPANPKRLRRKNNKPQARASTQTAGRSSETPPAAAGVYAHYSQKPR